LLEHGGNLRQAAKKYGIPIDQWLDLSTGINPQSWYVPPLPMDCWGRLPEQDDGLIQAAINYYQCPSLLAVAGSQAAIQTLPYLRPHSKVGILTPSYNEHAYAWTQAGHQVIPITSMMIESQLACLDVLLLVNPNNPTGERFDQCQLMNWWERLQQKQGWLMIDEAFIDSHPPDSLANQCPQTGLIVLRSVGKFFGLAGIRVGFVLAEEALLSALAQRLGPWSIAHPSRWVASQALQDKAWQQLTRQQLSRQGNRLNHLLTQYQLSPTGGCELFQWIKHENASMIHQQLAEQGIWSRLFTEPVSFRLGLPATEGQWQQLEQGLSGLK